VDVVVGGSWFVVDVDVDGVGEVVDVGGRLEHQPRR
jgi:hypothetical protein